MFILHLRHLNRTDLCCLVTGGTRRKMVTHSYHERELKQGKGIGTVKGKEAIEGKLENGDCVK